MAHVRHPRERLAEQPGAERPERISRRMRNAQVGGSGGKLAGILKPHGRAKGVEIHGERGERGSPERRPVDFCEKPRLQLLVARILMHGSSRDTFVDSDSLNFLFTHIVLLYHISR